MREERKEREMQEERKYRYVIQGPFGRIIFISFQRLCNIFAHSPWAIPSRPCYIEFGQFLNCLLDALCLTPREGRPINTSRGLEIDKGQLSYATNEAAN